MSGLHVTSGDAYGLDGSNDRRLIVRVTKDGANVDLTDVDLTFMVKNRRSDEDDEALFTKTIGSGITLATQTGDTIGKAYITLTEANTESLAGRYFWELEADDAVGKLTLASGEFRVASDMIRGA
jgi:hypothetical protein